MARDATPSSVGSSRRFIVLYAYVQRLASWHLISPSGERRAAGAALPSLLGLLPGGSTAACVLALAPGLTERSYRWVAEHRSLLSRAIPASAKRRASRTLDEGEARR